MAKAYYGSNAALTALIASATKLALYSVMPTVSTAGTELSGSNYSRTTITWGSPASGAVSNSAAFQTPTASANWTAAAGYALLDSSGNIYYFQAFSSSVTVLSGQYLYAAIGALVLTET
jgi:hypothetical protein